MRIDDGETRAQARLMDNLDATVFEGGGLFLICTSTYGQGDVPDNAKQLYESLQTARPDLCSHTLRGHRVWVTAPTPKLSATAAGVSTASCPSLGAKRIGEVLLHDASAGTMPEEVAAEWIDGWVALCRERIGESAGA